MHLSLGAGNSFLSGQVRIKRQLLFRVSHHFLFECWSSYSVHQEKSQRTHLVIVIIPSIWGFCSIFFETEGIWPKWFFVPTLFSSLFFSHLMRGTYAARLNYFSAKINSVWSKVHYSRTCSFLRLQYSTNKKRRKSWKFPFSFSPLFFSNMLTEGNHSHTTRIYTRTVQIQMYTYRWDPRLLYEFLEKWIYLINKRIGALFYTPSIIFRKLRQTYFNHMRVWKMSATYYTSTYTIINVTIK